MGNNSKKSAKKVLAKPEHSPEDVNRWLRCPACDSRNILYSKRTKHHDCRRCGTEFKADFKRCKCVAVD